MSGNVEVKEIVACGEALKLAQQWLGINRAEQVLADTPVDNNFAKARPLGLGLGAKYLPHHKAVALTAGVEDRLNRKLKRARADKEAAAEREGPSGRIDADVGDESGDEERGRASAFIGGRVPPRKLVQDWFQGKQELQPSLSSGKKKRKKRNKSGQVE